MTEMSPTMQAAAILGAREGELKRSWTQTRSGGGWTIVETPILQAYMDAVDAYVDASDAENPIS